MKQPNVVFILGASYCGSTLLGYQLGSLKNCVSIGEVSQWTSPDRGYIEYSRCSSCRTNCKYITDEFLHGTDINNVYYRYAELFDVTNMVDSSKSPWYFRQHVLPAWGGRANIIPLIMYKSPLEFYASARIRKREDKIGVWGTFYEQALLATANIDNTIVLSYKDFATENEAWLKYLCGIIGEEYEPGIVEYWNYEHHQMGGNNMTNLNTNESVYDKAIADVFDEDIYKLERNAYYKKISYMEKAKDVLPKSEYDSISRHDEMNEIFAELEQNKTAL